MTELWPVGFFLIHNAFLSTSPGTNSQFISRLCFFSYFSCLVEHFFRVILIFLHYVVKCIDLFHKWTATLEIVPTDMYTHCSLFVIFTGHISDIQGCKISLCGQRRLWSHCADAQADFESSLRASIRRYVFCRYDSIHIKGKWFIYFQERQLNQSWFGALLKIGRLVFGKACRNRKDCLPCQNNEEKSAMCIRSHSPIVDWMNTPTFYIGRF